MSTTAAVEQAEVNQSETVAAESDILYHRKFKQYVSLITDPDRDDASRFKAGQELSEHLEVIVQNPHYSDFLSHLLNEFLRFLEAGEPIYLENTRAQIRKLVMEIIHRLPRNNDLETHVRRIQNVMFRFIEVESEECALLCTRIIYDLHRTFKPSNPAEIQEVSEESRVFLQFVAACYSNLHITMRHSLLNEQPGGSQRECRPIPKATQSLKVVAELPLAVVAFFQTFPDMIEEDVSKLIHIMMNTLALHPDPSIMNSEHFVQDAFVDFITVQIKTITFLAFLMKHPRFREIIEREYDKFIKGLIACFRCCPNETPHLRRELIVACRHLLNQDQPDAVNFKYRMVNYIDQLLDENTLIGTGYTSKQGARCIAYSTLAELIHQVRDKLSLKQLTGIVCLFGKNIHNSELPSSMQNMSCKIFINIANFIKDKSEKESASWGRDLMMRMIEIFVNKFETVAKHQLPALFARCAIQTGTEIPTSPPPPEVEASSSDGGNSKKGQSLAMKVQDCRVHIRTLMFGVRTLTWTMWQWKNAPSQHKFLPSDTYLFIRLLRYGVSCLNIYRIQVGPPPNRITYIRAATNSQVRSKEERESMEHFANLFVLRVDTFKEVFETQMEFLVEAIHNNHSLTAIPYHYLVPRERTMSQNPQCSSVFAYQLARYLMQKLPDMGLGENEPQDRAALYSRLWRQLFSFTQAQDHHQDLEMEGILKPHLQKILNNSMELAQTAKDPSNYFTLLRHLFRVIGSASNKYDELYNEFLPLLPSLLQSLNRLQSGVHKQQMRDIFIELVLTIPVRLSNLIPYLPALMDPLVSALNGSNLLIAQGLRTLELCTDNLEPNFFYLKIEPVRAELIKALWKILFQNSNENDANAKYAFRVLGKCGARNRKTLPDLPSLEYVNPDSVPASVHIWFPYSETPVKLPVQKVLDHALLVLKSPDKDVFYMQHGLYVCQSYIISMINLSDTTPQIQKLLATISWKQGQAQHIPSISKGSFICSDEPTRTAFRTALLGLFIATATKQLRAETTQFMMSVVRHFSLLTIVQQSGVFLTKRKGSSSLDVHVLVDVIAQCVGSEQSELANIGEKAIRLVTETCKYILGSADRAFQMPFFDVLLDKLCGLCYERAWFSKRGGVTALDWLIGNAPLLWVIKNQQPLISATMYTMIDLSEEVSYGTLGLAEALFQRIIRHCNTPHSAANVTAAQEKPLPGMVHHLVKEMLSPYAVVRKQARQSLLTLSEITKKSVKDLVDPLSKDLSSKDLIADTILPKKQPLSQLPETRQLACMEAVVFCSTLEPRLLSLEPTGPNDVEREKLLKEILLLCSMTPQALMAKFNCYKRETNFSLLKKTGLQVLATCYYLPQHEPEIFKVMYTILTGHDKELQLCAKNAIQTYQKRKEADILLDTVTSEIRPLLSQLPESKKLSIHLIEILAHLMELFPTLFNDKLRDQLLKHLRKWMENIFQNSVKKSINTFSEEVLLCQAIINTFHLVPPPPKSFLSQVISYVVRAEKYLNVEIGSPFQEGVFKFVLKHPGDAIDLFLKELQDQTMNRMFYNFLRHKDGGPLRTFLGGMTSQLLAASNQGHDSGGPAEYAGNPTLHDSNKRFQEARFQGILITSLLVKHDPELLVRNPDIVTQFRSIWNLPLSQEKFRNPDKLEVPTHQWREPKLLAKCLLNYLERNPSDFELLFQLLHIFDAIYVPNKDFLHTYIQKKVVEGFTIEQRRECFFCFIAIYKSSSTASQGRASGWTQELIGKILQYVLVPMFQYSFERGDTAPLIEGTTEGAGNIINTFMDRDSRIIVEESDIIDVVRIHVLKLSAEFIKHAADYIHPTNNNRRQEGAKIRSLMRYAWLRRLSPKTSRDPTTKYYGQLVLSLIISKFPILQKIVIQVFHSLLKAHYLECRGVVFQALEIITPAMPSRMDDGKAMLYHWTKKIIVEEGHTISQLVHLLSLIVKQYRVYYLWRQYLIQHIVTAMLKFAFTQSVTIEHQRLACDLAEVLLKWEVQRVHEKHGVGLTDEQIEGIISGKTGMLINQKEIEVAPYVPPTKVNLSPSVLRPPAPDPLAPFEARYGDGVFNFLLKLSFSAYSTVQLPHSETLSKRCIHLVKLGMKPELDIFKNATAKVSSWADGQLGLIQKLVSEQQKGPDAKNDQGPTDNQIQSFCTILQLLEFLLDMTSTEVILFNVYSMSRGLIVCINAPIPQITRTVHSLLGKLFAQFPIDQNREELAMLFDGVSEHIIAGLEKYEKNPERVDKETGNLALEALYSPLMILRAACATAPRYLERFMKEWIKCLQKLQKEHCNSPKEAQSKAGVRGEKPPPTITTADLIMVCVELVKDRMNLLINDVRKLFFAILQLLIERSGDAQLLKSLTEMVSVWVKSASSQVSLKEKTQLLIKMNQNFENKFPTESGLLSVYLDIILYVYTDPGLQAELGMKMESAFMTGLRFTDPQLRNKFTEVLRNNVSPDLFERLMALISPKIFNWRFIGQHFWIKQFVEMLLTVNEGQKPLKVPNEQLMLPSLVRCAELAGESGGTAAPEGSPGDITGDINTPNPSNLQVLSEKHGAFLESLKEHKSGEFVQSVCQLAHDSTSLAEHLWVRVFPEIWNTLNKDQQLRLSRDLPPFLCAAMHHEQGELQPSSIGCFLQSISKIPSIPLRPCYLKYLGSTHNAWHQMALKLEELGTSGETFQTFQRHQKQVLGEYPVTEAKDRMQYEAVDCLIALYSQLNEHDMWTGLWLRRCKNPETIKALGYQNLGFYELAQATYEGATKTAAAQLKTGCATATDTTEFKLWKDQWVECTRQCGQWNLLHEIATVKGSQSPSLLLESSWRLGDWQTFKDLLSQADRIMPEEAAHLVSLYRGYLSLHLEEESAPSESNPSRSTEGPAEAHWKRALSNALKQWRKLPPIVGNVHIPLLQFAQQAIEMKESLTNQKSSLSSKVRMAHSNYKTVDFKLMLKAWRNRPLVISDDISHWNDIYSWRQYYHQKIVDFYGPIEHGMGEMGPEQMASFGSQNALIAQQSSASAMVTYASLARKHGMASMAQEWLARIHTLPSVPVPDCFKKLKEQIKTHLLPPASQQDIIAALDVIEGVNMRTLSQPDYKAYILAQKAHIFAILGKSDEAMKTFSQAIQISGNVPGAWALWAQYCDELFHSEVEKGCGDKEKGERGSVYRAHLSRAESALACYLQACSKQKDDCKTRKYIARILWLITFDSEEVLVKTLEKFFSCVAIDRWVEWVPQLLAGLGGKEARVLHPILNKLGKQHPQALYFPIRNLILTVRGEYQEIMTRHNAAKELNKTLPDGDPEKKDIPDQPPELNRLRPRMAWCSKLLNNVRELHPTMFSALESIIDTLCFMKDAWYDEVLQKLYTAIHMCETEAFKIVHRQDVLNVKISPQIYRYITGIITYLQQVPSRGSRESSKQSMKARFEADFDFTNNQGKKLHKVLKTLKCWVKMLDKTQMSSSKTYMEERCSFLSKFCPSTADVYLIGEYLTPKAHYVKIARFLPKIETVRKHSLTARRLFIRGSNGKVYPYLMVNTSANIQRARSEERFLQLLRMLNSSLLQRKESCRRNLQWCVPKVVAIAPGSRLIEDNTSNLSLLEIYKWYCKTRTPEMEIDAPIAYYYDQLGHMQNDGSVLNRIALNKIYHYIQTHILPPTVLLDWAKKTYPDPVMFWNFRQQITRHTALDCLAQFSLYVISLKPEHIYITQETGQLSAVHYHIPANRETGEFIQEQHIPLRVTPNMIMLMGPIALSGPFLFAMIAAARTLVDPKLGTDAILHAMLKDEAQACIKEPSEARTAAMVEDIQCAVSQITVRLETAASFEKAESKLPGIISLMTTPEILCKLDPALYPWL